MRWILGTALTAGFALSGPAQAQDCAATIDGNDAVQFSLSEMKASSSCESFTVTLKHVGTLAANVMGHNWVLTATRDFESVAVAGQSAGADNNYVPPGDARVIAATRIIGGGEETSVTFDASALEPGGDYTYFCSFPGHYVLMKGKLIVE
ncbi:MAG: azurin [Gammaproteobacteria bacterium]|jgi:azurin